LLRRRSKLKPITVALGPLKKDPKAATKKVLDTFNFPMHVKALNDEMPEFNEEVADKASLLEALQRASVKAKAEGLKLVVEPDTCDFTKENFAAKPDLNSPEADGEQEDEFCDNCGRVMVLRNGPWGPFMACPGYNEDPPCKTIRKLTQKVQTKPPVVLEEPCPKCGKPLLQRDGQYGEFIACSGYPKCKYVKQDLLDVPCPKCDSAYLVEYDDGEATYLVCPNNREFLPKRRVKKGAPEEAAPTTPECSFEKKIGPSKPKEEAVEERVKPDPEKTRTLVEALA